MKKLFALCLAFVLMTLGTVTHINASSEEIGIVGTLTTENEITNLSYFCDSTTEENKITYMNDKSSDTMYNVDLSEKKSINVKLDKDNNFTYHGQINNIILYVSSETANNIENIDVIINANNDSINQAIVSNYAPVWSDAGDLKKAVIDLPAVMCREFWIELTGISAVDISECILEGKIYDMDLGKYVQYRKNNNLQDGQVLFDNNISSKELVNQNDKLEFDFSPYKVELSEFVFTSNFPDKQSLKSGTLEYWDGTDWVMIENQKSFDYEMKNSQARGVGNFTFDNITTEKLRLSVDECNREWGSTMIMEIFIDGIIYIDCQAIADSLDQFPEQDTEKLQLPTYPTQLLEDYSIDIISSSQPEIVDLNGNITAPEIDQVVMIQFKVLNNLNSEDYVITEDIAVNIQGYSDEPVTVNELIENLAISSNLSTINGDKEFATDGDMTTTWEVEIADTDSNLEIYTIESTEGYYKNFKNDTIILYAAGDVPDSLTASVDQFANYKTNAYQNILSDYTINWMDEGDYKKAEIPLPVDTASFKYRLGLKGAGSLELTEVQIAGQPFVDDLYNYATLYKNDVLVADKNVYDTQINTSSSGFKAGDELVFDFSPYSYSLNSFYFTMNFPQSQSIASGSLEYWDGNNWITLTENTAFDWKTNNDTREINGFEFDEITTRKIKFIISDVNNTWTPAIQEVFIRGNRIIDINELANMIQEVPQQLRDATSLIMPSLPIEQDKYIIKIDSTDNLEVLDEVGNIVPPPSDTVVNVVFKIISKASAEEALCNTLPVIIPAKTPENYILLQPEEEDTAFIKNPGMGWVTYVEYFCEYHDEMHLDHYNCIDSTNVDAYFDKLDAEIAKGLKPSILYIRMGWSWFEPEEGQYAWRDPDSVLSQYIAKAKERELQFSFRVRSEGDYVADDQEEAIPNWLFEKEGFSYYTVADNTRRVPYYDNEVYLEYYEKLVEALGEDFDDSDFVAFIDAQGLGIWGEMHDVRTSGRWTKDEAIEEHAKIWTKYFNNVLLGATFGGGAEDINENVIVPNYDHMVRRDGYGSKWITTAFKDMYKNKFFPMKIPSYAEVCYWHLSRPDFFTNLAAQESSFSLTGDDETDYRYLLDYCIDQAQELRANTLDLRVPSDWSVWTEYGQDYIDKFAKENGYRLVPVSFLYPKTMEAGEDVKILHEWKNTAYGFLPTADYQLKDKYKIAFALMDESNNVVYQFTDANIDPSWIKEDGIQQKSSTLSLPTDIASGDYKLCVAIVNTLNNNMPGINLATKLDKIDIQENTEDPLTWYGGWYVISEDLTVESTANVYTLTFDTNGGSELASITTEGVLTIDAPIQPTRSGYIFNYWTINSDRVEFPYTINGNVTMVANWIKESSSSSSSSSPSPSTPSNNFIFEESVVSRDSTYNVVHIENSIKKKEKVVAGITYLAVDDATVEKLISKMQQTNLSEENVSNGIDIKTELSVSSDINALKKSTTKITSHSLDNIVKVVNADVKITSPIAQFILDNDTLGSITEQAQGSAIKFEMGVVDNIEISEDDESNFASRPVFDFTIQSGEEEITSFNGGSITIRIPYTLQEGEQKESITIYYVEPSGNLSTITNCVYDENTQEVIFQTNHLSKYMIGYKKAGFTDITDHWASKYINFVASRGIFQGIDKHTFNPEGYMTRGMMITVIGRLVGIDKSQYQSKEEEVYYAPYVSWAKDAKFMSALDKNQFLPNEEITRDNMWAFIHNFLSYTGKILEVSPEMLLEKITTKDIHTGLDNYITDPQGKVTRAEISAIISELINLLMQ